MNYREAPPSTVLRRAIVSHWTVSGGVDGGSVAHTVYPDGCFDLVIVVRGHVSGDGPGRSLRGAQIVGPMTRAAEVRRSAGAELVGVRFRPGPASWLLGVPMAELRDRTLPAVELLGPRIDELAERVAGMRDFGNRTRVIESAFASWLGAARLEQEDGLLDRLCLGDPVWKLVAGSGLSERQVQRRFLRDVGLTPSEVVRLRRFRTALRCLDRRASGSLSALAAELGFSDHAHFTREFTAFAGRPPSSFARAHAMAPEPGSDLFKRE